MSASEIVDTLMDLGIAFEVSRVSSITHYAPVDGFYKSDGMAYLIDEPSGETVLRARYNERTVVESAKDVIRISREWYQFSKDRFSGWSEPPRNWKALYETLP